ncbi:MAG: hypothetical protein ACYCT9_04835 [Leptospirillum sp.]
MTEKIDLIQFRELVDRSPHSAIFQNSNLSGMYSYIGLPVKNNLTQQEGGQEIYSKIQGSFLKGGSAASSHFRRLTTELIYSHVIYQTPLEPYLTISEYLRDALRNSGDHTQEITGEWKKAVGYAVNYYILNPNGFHSNDWKRIYAREYEVASAARFLNGIGYKIEIAEDKITLSEESNERLVKDLNNLVEKMGGINLARRIFAEIQASYDVTQERYHIGRRTSLTGGGAAQVPFAYLLNLASKHPIGIKPYQNTQEDWERIKTLSLCYAALFDVQDYYPNIFSITPRKITNYLRQLALHDSLFFITQFRGRDVIRLIEGLLKDIDQHQKFGDGWTIEEVLKVTSVILKMANNSRGPMVISLNSILKNCPQLKRSEIHSVLKSVLSHPPTGANQYFFRPDNLPVKEINGKVIGGVDFFTRPLLRYGENNYFLLDRAYCSLGFIEATFEKLRCETKNFDDSRGKLIENFLIDEFKSRGISGISGTYSVGNISGDCDLVVETDEAIIFFEIKKKALTRNSRVGSPAHVLIDLSTSLIDALIQANKHEITIRKNNSIELEKDGLRNTLKLDGRGIEKIVVTLFDFGGFQDRLVVKHFLEAIVQVNFNCDSDDFKDQMSKLNDSIEILRTQNTQLNALKGNDEQPYFECWFLSIPQILVLLDNVTDSKSFRERLWKIRHIIRGTQDFYFEFSEAFRH